ncbi:G-type lectin S-receptor-like serine/threonine-protein kinase [Dichanthelium oligosanthes]|uniref:Receptor-like serine/threonine-protein kinase n=1 Tax=Dichanthelium oligosanthes TaxID=888268 RepID=A0A1E5VIW0_9POAL|nr:G-type lectin S-receptor-like serine/threonine-protein kinase [Dichanthelium oligosanthes]
MPSSPWGRHHGGDRADHMEAVQSRQQVCDQQGSTSSQSLKSSVMTESLTIYKVPVKINNRLVDSKKSLFNNHQEVIHPPSSLCAFRHPRSSVCQNEHCLPPHLLRKPASKQAISPIDLDPFFHFRIAMRLLVVLLLGLVSYQRTPSSSAATNTLSRSQALAGDEKLVSSNGKFALGFFQTGSESSNNTLRSYLGIWFHKVPKLTPVWTANGEAPISKAASPELVISEDGNLAILAQGTVTVWSTQANGTTKDASAVLLDNGNLVLRSSLNSSAVFWQSFDYPTDTFMMGAKLGLNKVTGLNRRLVSRKNSIDQASGVYSMEFSLDGIFRLLWNSSTGYWSSGEWNGKFFSSIPEMSEKSDVVHCNYTFVNNDQDVYFSTDCDESVVFHNFLDVSGLWTNRIWLNQDWITLALHPQRQCDVHAACGPFTVCTDNGNPLCNCMKGFSVQSPQDWGLGDTEGGCIRNAPLSYCSGDKNKTSMSDDKFYSMPSIRLPDNGKGVSNAMSAKDCAETCLNSCSCTAYSYGKGGCSVWHDELLNAVVDSNGQTLYLRLAAKEVNNSKSNRSALIIGVATSTCIISLGLVFLIVVWRRKGNCWSSGTENNDGGIGVIPFRYIELRRATKNFSEKLGEGGFGSVFKGSLTNSVVIAVKRLDRVNQGEKQFRAEVSSIGIIQHINLVKLIGFCCEGDKRLLVYEHMPNSSLDAHLFQTQGTILDWNVRYQIALGVARGLSYLHHSCRDCIIHCDIKPQNILLDISFLPKISDFGMAKFLERDFNRVMTTMRGTIGYIAPEWISGTAITSKVDVYSYGMVLLEIISGKRNSAKLCSGNGHEGYFPVQVAHKLLDGDVESLVDANLHGDVNLQEVERVCKIACWCIQDNEFDRPTMVEVLQFLEGVSEPNIPPMPRLLHAISGGH